MTNFQIQISTAGSNRVAKISGYADATNVEAVHQNLVAVIGELPAAGSLILDGENLEFINSTFIGYLTDWYSRVTEKNGQLFLARLRPNVLDTLTIVGLTNLLPHFVTLEEALLSVSSNSSQPQTQPVEQNWLTV